MGANDAGVVGGNEAVFTRFAVPKVGVTGMDLLRLALEQVRGVRTISNALSIGVPDEVHAGAADEARRRGWLSRGETFEFAKCFGSPLYRHLTGGWQRQACTTKSLDGASDARAVMRTLRNHRGAHPAEGLRLESPCSHASWEPTRHAGQTTSSMASELSSSGARHWMTGTSSPCLSVFRPARLDVEPGMYGPFPGARADEASLWWRHERLHRAVLRDWAARSGVVESERARPGRRAQRREATEPLGAKEGTKLGWNVSFHFRDPPLRSAHTRSRPGRAERSSLALDGRSGDVVTSHPEAHRVGAWPPLLTRAATRSVEGGR